jgi:molybdopterin molybdotransferase
MSTLSSPISVAEAIASFARIQPVKPRLVLLTEAVGLRLAEDVVARRIMPPEPLAARNGYAVAAASTAGASDRRPRALPADTLAIETGMPLPHGVDAVLGKGSVIRRGKGLAATAAVAVGEGVAAAGSSARPGHLIAQQGSRVSFGIAMSASACGIADVMVRRPVVDIVFNAPSLPHPGQTVGIICSAIRGSGCDIGTIAMVGGDARALRSALLGSSGDLITVVGGMGDGEADSTKAVLAEIGETVFMGVRMQPGGQVGFGLVEGKPVFCSPGRLPDMLAANIVLSWPFARRTFGRPEVVPRLQEVELLADVPAYADRAHLVFAAEEDGKALPLLDPATLMMDIARANCTLFLPEGAAGYRKGQTAPAYRIGITM